MIYILGVEPEDVAVCAPLTATLKEANGGLADVLAAMRFSPDPVITAFLKVYDKAGEAMQELVPWEAFALKAKVDVPQLMGAIIFALRQHSANVVKVIATTNHADMVKASIKFGKKIGGVKDRNAMHTAMRFLPAQKGQTIINLPPGMREEADAISEGDVEADPDFLFPNLADTQKLLSE